MLLALQLITRGRFSDSFLPYYFRHNRYNSYITKHFITCPLENTWFCFSLNLDETSRISGKNCFSETSIKFILLFLTYDELDDRHVEDTIDISFFFPYFTKQKNSLLFQNVVRTSMTHSATTRPPLFLFLSHFDESNSGLIVCRYHRQVNPTR